jgi:hydrophobic/amphiphilic exporter-1 (mainly G- bacteria), HAE1 family
MGGKIIKAENLINYEVGQGPNVINRFNRMRSVSLYANVKGIPMSEGLIRVEKTAEKYIPKNTKWGTALSGKSSAFRESFMYMTRALLIAILVIYMILSIQFESFVHAFTILFSLPLTLVGVFGALLLTGMELTIFSMIGVIMLMGIVTKNAILLVDFANQERQRGVNKVEAIENAGKIRLRPILMTAIATIIGVLPVAIGLSEGGETRAPMAVAVIGGLITNTFLTLLVIPVVYLLFDDATEWVKAKAGAGWQRITKKVDKT